LDFQWSTSTGPFVPVNAEWFILYLNADEYLIPSIAHPSSVFFLLSLANWLEAWHVWLMPALIHRKQQVCYFSPFFSIRISSLIF
jgi:hypothetical protein